MVKHIIIWNFKESMTSDEKTKAASKIKEGLEGLIDKIEGLVEISVEATPLSSSNGDLMLDSSFVDEDALKDYQVDPEHLKVAEYVRSVMDSRKCFDYEI